MVLHRLEQCHWLSSCWAACHVEYRCCIVVDQRRCFCFRSDFRMGHRLRKLSFQLLTCGLITGQSSDVGSNEFGTLLVQMIVYFITYSSQCFNVLHPSWLRILLHIPSIQSPFNSTTYFEQESMWIHLFAVRKSSCSWVSVSNELFILGLTFTINLTKKLWIICNKKIYHWNLFPNTNVIVHFL